jgi:peptide deformylase
MPDEFIRQWGDPALHQRALPIAALDDLVRRQLARMRERLWVAEGAGLAATQVGILRRMFVYRLRPEDPIEVLVNPEIVAASSERAVFLEGCLSFNSVVVAVERAVSVRIRGADLDGRVTVREYEGFGASLVQHELDHLDGILTLDRATLEERRRATALLIAGATARAA